MSSLFPALDTPLLESQHEELLGRFKAASSPAALHDIITQIDSQTERIDSDLRHFCQVLSRQHEQEISTLEVSRAKLSGAIGNSNELTKMFGSADDLAASLTAKIKSFDTEISNVDATIEFVTGVQTLKNNIQQTQYAIEKGNWELAANCIHYINHDLDKGLVHGKFASVVIPTSEIPELPGPTVLLWTAHLCKVFQERFTEAAKNRSVAEITKYFQLFPLIDEEEAGLDCYSRFICSIVADTSRTLVRSATSSDDTRHGVYAAVTSSLFDSLSTMLNQHTPLINRYYGATYAQAVSYVVAKLQREVDTQMGLIADTFYDGSRIEKVLQDVQLHRFTELNRHVADNHDHHDHSTVADDDVVPLADIGDLIHEIASILRSWALYCNFITVRYFGSGGPDHLELPELLANAAFRKKVQNKLLPAFEALYVFYFRRSLEKAISIEEVPLLDTLLTVAKTSSSPEQPPVSSVVEDISLVFNNTLRNVLESSHVSTVHKFVTVAFGVIKNDFLNGFILRALHDNPPRYNSTLALVAPGSKIASGMNTPADSRAGTPGPDTGGGFFRGASSALGNVVGTGSNIVTGTASNSPKQTNHVVYLNTVAAAQEYLKKITENLTKLDPHYIKNNFPFGIDDEKTRNILQSELLQPLVTETNNIIRGSLVQLYNTSMKSKVAAMVNECFPDHTDETFMIFSSVVLDDSSNILAFKEAWDALIKPYRQTLHKSLVYEKLLRLLVVNIASLVEKRLFSVLRKFKINELGSLKLDKDVSFIINEVCEDDYELREKFVRLTQFVLLVGIDDDEYELNSFSNDDDEDSVGINWVLTPLEKKQIRRLRV